MNLGLTDRVAIVTGTSTGIGFACAAELLAEGAHVVAVNRDAEKNAKTTAALAARGKGRAIGVPTDINDDAAVRALVERTLKEFGRLDILVNNAAVVAPGNLFNMTDEQFGRIFEQKLNGTARCMRHAIPPMRERKWGRIVNVTGGAGVVPQPAAVATGMNNAAILNFTKAMAGELAKDGILLNSVLPGTIRTERLERNVRNAAEASGKPEAEVMRQRVERIPLARMGEAEEIGAVVAFLCSERASYVVGAGWLVDGGATPVIV
jgi:NAD(P)-dependent dehydrogenase (short-subunit alcohol dehydrogenase family)